MTNIEELKSKEEIALASTQKFDSLTEKIFLKNLKMTVSLY
jgi:hypothetical protein